MKYSGEILSGNPYPLGATFDGNGVNFAIFSKHAEAVSLYLFGDETSSMEYEEVPVTEVSGNIWHIYLAGLGPGQRYGYKIEGKYDPKTGFRYHSGKLLIDPYARAIEGRINMVDSMFDYTYQHRSVGNVFEKDDRDSVTDVNKCVVVDNRFDWEGIKRPGVLLNEMIIYELHVKGFTAMHPAVPLKEQGTFRGLANPEVIDYFKSLGINAIELMPVHHYIHNTFLLDNGLSNYWGYNSIGFFAPHAEFSSGGSKGEQVVEFKEMVKAYHRNGIEVIIDVVYNHTGEGDHLGPTIAFRGIDNASYYRLNLDKKFYYQDYTGTGNTLDLSQQHVLQLVMDSLRYWADEMQVDGFRFDLASTLTRGAEGNVFRSGFLDAVHQDPVLSKLKLIAEPWDLGPDGYQVGNFPSPWLEWNGKYRDSVRRFWRGDESQIKELSRRLSGSGDIYSGNNRPPTASINFVTAHDGFTLHDLVSYNRKYNLKNKEDNRDGEEHNISWNSGVEGPTEEPEIVALREKRKRNFLATLLLSQGVPMISHGDEYGRSQQGNNNAYCQDNETTWMKWDWDEKQRKLHEFTKRMISLRRNFPVLRFPEYIEKVHGKHDGKKPVRWLNTEGKDMSHKEWESDFIRCMGMLLNGELMAEAGTMDDQSGRDVLLVLLNSYWDPVIFRLPSDARSTKWRILIDTAGEWAVESREIYTNTYQIQSRSLVLLKNVK
jgi:isoamylase